MYGATEELCRSPAVAEEAEHSPVPVASLGADADERVGWLQRCAPVIMQPQLDVANGFGLRRVFFDFRPSERICELSLVYDGEASYGYLLPPRHSSALSTADDVLSGAVVDWSTNLNGVSGAGTPILCL